MKAVFKHAIQRFIGTNTKEDLVYCSYNHGDLQIVRTRPRRETDENNKSFGSVGANLSRLYHSLSEEYLNDLKSYTLMLATVQYDPNKLPMGHYAVFTRMVWSLKGQFPEIDMSTVSRDDILNAGYPVYSVKEAMESGHLFMIPEAMCLDRKI